MHPRSRASAAPPPRSRRCRRTRPAAHGAAGLQQAGDGALRSRPPWRPSRQPAGTAPGTDPRRCGSRVEAGAGADVGKIATEADALRRSRIRSAWVWGRRTLSWSPTCTRWCGASGWPATVASALDSFTGTSDNEPASVSNRPRNSPQSQRGMFACLTVLTIKGGAERGPLAWPCSVASSARQ